MYIKQFASLSIAALLGALCGATAAGTTAEGRSTAAQALDGNALTTTTWRVDARGRPPFDRTRVEVPVVDVAAVETLSAEPVETVTIWAVDHSGKPPYKRTRIEVPVVDASSLQLEGDGERGTRFRGKPPFRRH